MFYLEPKQLNKVKECIQIHYLARMTSPSTYVDLFALSAARRLRLSWSVGVPLDEGGWVLFGKNDEVFMVIEGCDVLPAAKTEKIRLEEKEICNVL